MHNPVSIDIWSDIACPWCYLGERSLAAALDSFAHKDEVSVRFRSYQLAPDAPAEISQTQKDYLVQVKGLSEQQVQASFDTITARGAELGLHYDFATVRGANTRAAHRLIQFALQAGKQQELVDALFRAHFEQGLLVSDPEMLVSLAVSVGLDPEQARAALSSQEYDREVSDDIEMARGLGIQGVPFFVLNGRFGVSGAQPVEAFTQVLDQVWNSPAGQQ